MTAILTAIMLALFFGLTVVSGQPAAAETALTNDMITIEYHPPRSEKFLPIFERLKKRQILEELAEFLSPLELDSTLALSLEEGNDNCKAPNSYYDMAGTVHLCYSWFYYLEKEVGVEQQRPPGEPFTATSLGLMPGVTRADVLIGGTIDVITHELGHAVFDLADIPRLGREEDAADQFGALLMLQFGDEIALTTIKGTYNGYHHFEARRLRDKRPIQPREEADVHSLNMQRAYNYLCMAYGKNPALFEEWAALLPRTRRENCAAEYKQAEFAFAKTIMPRLDQEKVKLVRKMRILKPEDFQTDF
jgi:hypothetical protein